MRKLTKNLLLTSAMAVLSACSSNSDSLGLGGSDSNAFNGYSIQELQQRENTIYFGFDRYDIDPQYQGVLKAQAAYLMAYPEVNVQVQGFTDERGTPEYNIALGQRRADAVHQYLLNQGVNPAQLSTISYGEEKPAVLGHTEVEAAKNRRAVLAY